MASYELDSNTRRRLPPMTPFCMHFAGVGSAKSDSMRYYSLRFNNSGLAERWYDINFGTEKVCRWAQEVGEKSACRPGVRTDRLVTCGKVMESGGQYLCD